MSVSRIPGLRGQHEPAFMTRDRRLVSLDRVVTEVVTELATQGLAVSAHAAKCCVQAARKVLALVDEALDLETLSEVVSAELRRARMLVRPAAVQDVLKAYAALLVSLDVVEIT